MQIEEKNNVSLQGTYVKVVDRIRYNFMLHCSSNRKEFKCFYL